MSSTETLPPPAEKAAIAPVALPHVRLALIDYHSGLTCLNVDGKSGKQYTFVFDKAVQAFVYDATCQEDIHDLCRTNGRFDFFCITALIEAGAGGVEQSLRDQLASAEKLVADMHAAAVGEVRAPLVGVVEEVALVRRAALEALAEIDRLNTEVTSLHAIHDNLRQGASENAARGDGLRAELTKARQENHDLRNELQALSIAREANVGMPNAAVESPAPSPEQAAPAPTTTGAEPAAKKTGTARKRT